MSGTLETHTTDRPPTMSLRNAAGKGARGTFAPYKVLFTRWLASPRVPYTRHLSRNLPLPSPRKLRSSASRIFHERFCPPPSPFALGKADEQGGGRSFENLAARRQERWSRICRAIIALAERNNGAEFRARDNGDVGTPAFAITYAC